MADLPTPRLMSDSCDELERLIARQTDADVRSSLGIFLQHIRSENAMDARATMATMTADGFSTNFGPPMEPRTMSNADRLGMYEWVFETCPESWTYQDLGQASFVASKDHVVQYGPMRVVAKGANLALWGGTLPDDGDPAWYYEVSFHNVITMRISDGLIDNEDVWNDTVKTVRRVTVDEAMIASRVATRVRLQG